MGFLDGLIKSAVDVVILPVAIAVDVVTVGQADATEKALDKLGDDVESITNGDIIS